LQELAKKGLGKIVMMRTSLPDNGGRRSGADRRQFSYGVHIPDKRLEEDRRSGTDRRNRANKIISTI